MMDWHYACSSLFPGRRGRPASRSLGGRYALLALLLAQLALPARLAAAEPGSNLSEIGWSRLLFVATEAASEVSAEVRLSPVTAEELAALLPADAAGLAKPGAEGMLMTGIVNIERFDKTFETDVWFLPRGATALKRRRLKTGKEPSLQTFWYLPEGVRRERADPEGRSQAKLPSDQWTRVREHFYPYGPPRNGCTTLTDPLLLVLVAHTAMGTKGDAQNGLCAFNKKSLHHAAWQPAATRELEVDFKLTDGGTVTPTKGQVAARQFVLRTKPVYGAGRKPDPFEVFEMAGNIEIWIDESTGLPLQISGQVSGIGTVSFVLKEATLRS